MEPNTMVDFMKAKSMVKVSIDGQMELLILVNGN